MLGKRSSRNDISLALIHLTGKRGAISAKEALLSILRDGVIKGSGNNGFVKGTKTASCFTEMPLSCIQSFVENSHHKHPYESYGIALSKEKGWERGARPVIYLPDVEGDWIPDEQKWRHVSFEFGTVVDYSPEREWRAEGDFYLLDIGFYVIVPNKEQEDLVRKQLSEEANRHIHGFLHMNILSQFL